MTTHIEREHPNVSNSILFEKPKIENVNTNNNNRTLLVGHSFSGKTSLLLKVLYRIPERDIYISNKSPPEQCSNAKTTIKEIGEETKLLKEYESAIVIFDDILGSGKSKYKDQFFVRGRHNNLCSYFLSQSFFDLPKRTIRENSNNIILFNQTIKVIDYIYGDVGGYDTVFDDLKQLSRETWKEKYNYFGIDRSKKEIREDALFE